MRQVVCREKSKNFRCVAVRIGTTVAAGCVKFWGNILNLRTIEELGNKLGKLRKIFTPEECKNYCQNAGYKKTFVQSIAEYALDPCFRENDGILRTLQFYSGIPAEDCIF